MALDGVVFNDVAKAVKKISQYIHKTPVITCSQADKRTGRKLFFKCECQQKTGSFKARGALNAVFKAKERSPDSPGLVTHSSGNHAQALGYASQVVGLPCYVVIPEVAPEVKKSAIRGYGAHLVECGPQAQDRYDTCEKLQKEKNLEYIPSSDHFDVIAGQGTISVEFLDQVPNLDAILVPVSGGGMASGIAIAAKAIKPDIKVFLVTPKGKRMEECLRSGKRPWEGPQQYLNTIADGIRLQQTGFITTPILIELAEKEVFEMEEQEIVQGMKFAFERMKVVIEAAAGASVAAALSDKMRAMDPKMVNIGVILCGGNVDIDHLPW